MRRRETYLNWLALVSHEFFHTWNVRRLRPMSLMNYDYEQEQFIEELWIAEGITSYFDDLCLVRTGLCSRAEYLARLTANVQAVLNAPGVRAALFSISDDFPSISLWSRGGYSAIYGRG